MKKKTIEEFTNDDWTMMHEFAGKLVQKKELDEAIVKRFLKKRLSEKNRD